MSATAAAWRPASNSNWNRMLHRERAAHLAGLTDWQLVEQAGVRARASGRSVEAVLVAWVLNGLMSYEHRLALGHALRDLVGITPAAFYDLAEADPFRASLALALLGPEGRFAFAAACGELLGQLYGRTVPALVVETAWRRAGLLGGAR
jgi:hypothetical protein